MCGLHEHTYGLRGFCSLKPDVTGFIEEFLKGILLVSTMMILLGSGSPIGPKKPCLGYP